MSLDIITNAYDFVYIIFEELINYSSIFKIFFGFIFFVFVFWGIRQWFFKR